MPFELIGDTWFYKFYPFKYVYVKYDKYYGEIERSTDIYLIFKREGGSYTESKFIWIKPWESYVRYFRSIFHITSTDSRNPFNSKFIRYMSQKDQDQLGVDLKYFMEILNYNDKLVQETIENHDLKEVLPNDPATRYVSEQCHHSIEDMIHRFQNYFKAYPLPGYERPIKQATKFKSLNNGPMYKFQKYLKPYHLVEETEVIPNQFIKKVYPSDIWRKEKHYYYEPMIRKVWKYRFD